METKKSIKVISFFLFALLCLASARIGHAQEVYLDTRFDVNADGFEYLDDTFLGTSQPADVDGVYSPSQGYDGGGLWVQLNVPEQSTTTKISGGWRRTFLLNEEAQVKLKFHYKLSQISSFDPGESSQVLVRVDGTLYGSRIDAVGNHKYVVEINNEDNYTTGWRRFNFDLGLLSAGEHSLVIGGYSAYGSSQMVGSSRLLIDNVLVVQTLPPVGGTRTDPPSPTAASLGKFGDIPVSLYSGTPNISIPLYEVKSRHLSVPISLSYHASGVKVGEIAGWTGLGWTLNAGGAITRTVKALPDDNKADGSQGDGGYLYTSGLLTDSVWNAFEPLAPPIGASVTYLDWALGQTVDPEPDLFFFNVSGQAGKFVMTSFQPQDVNLIPSQKVLVTPTKGIITIGVTSVDVIESWEVKTADGTTYIFGKNVPDIGYETSTNQTLKLQPPPDNNAAGFFISSWYLMRMEAANGDDFIDFKYSNENKITYKYLAFQELDWGACESTNSHPDFTEIEIGSRRLTQIITANETIDFIANTARDDVIGDNRLDEIIIKRRSNNFVKKKFQLNYDYFNSGSSNALEKRLKLTSVTEVGENGTALPSYDLSYNETLPLPNRLSAARDHWDYYNGATQNGEEEEADLIPFFVGLSPDRINPITVFLTGADREPNATYLLAGSLEEMTYPTGGKTRFYFEPHRYGKIADKNVQYQGSSLKQTPLHTGSSGITYFPFEIQGSPNDDLAVSLDVGYFGGPASCINLPCGTGNCFQVDIVEDDGSNTPVAGTQVRVAQTTLNFVLSAGEYKLRFCVGDDPDTGPPPGLVAIDARVLWHERMPTTAALAGGLRIQKIEHYDGVTKDASGQVVPIQVREYKYELASNPARSSGVLVNEPHYFYYPAECESLIRTSSSKTPLGLTQGSHIGYKEVTVFHGGEIVDGNGVGLGMGINGKSLHEFTTADDNDDYCKADIFLIGASPCEENSYNPTYPFWPIRTPTSHDWKRGLLKQRTDYDSSDSQILTVVNSYHFEDELNPTGVNEQVRSVGVSQGPAEEGGTPTPKFKRYEVRAAWQYMSQESTTSSFSSGSITTTRDDVYDSGHLQITSSTATNNDGSQRITDLKYAHEQFTGMANNDVHMFSQPYSTTVSDGTNDLSKSWTTWDDNNGQDPWRPQEQWVWKSIGASAPPDPSSGNSETIKTATFQDYDFFGNPLKILDAEGTETTYSWEQNDALLDSVVQNANGAISLVTNYNYDSNTLLPTEIIDPNGQKTTFDYDTFQRLIKTKNAAAQEVSIRDYFYSRQSSSADTFNVAEPNYVRQTLFRCDSDSTVATNYLDGLGRQISAQVRDGNDDIVQYNTYDALGRPDSSFKALQLTNSNHDFVQRSEFPAGPLYRLTEYEPNPLSRVSKVVNFDGTNVNFAYNAELFNGQIYRFDEITDEELAKSKEYFDEFGNGIAVINAVGVSEQTTTHFTSDILGNLTQSVAPKGDTTKYAYNTLNQLIAKTSPDLDGDGDGSPANENISNPDVQHKYDSKGNLRFTRDANHQQGGDDLIFYQYDALNRLLAIGQADDDATIPSWNNLDPDSLYTGSSGENFEDEANHPENFRIKNVYDQDPPYSANGIWQEAVDPGDLNNLKGRLSATAYWSEAFNKWGYTFYSYDNNSNLEFLVQDLPTDSLLTKKIDYQYDRQGNITKTSYNKESYDEFYQWHEYDEVGRLQLVFADTLDIKPATAIAQFTYWPSNQVKDVTYKNGRTISHTYTDRDWIKKIDQANSFTSDLDYDLVGNVKSMDQKIDSDLDGSLANETNYGYSNFGYDKLYRLTGATATASPAVSRGYKYDLNGNLLGLNRASDSIPNTTYLYYSGTNRLEYITDLSQSSGNYQYDFNGNLVQDAAKSITNDIFYDYRNLPYSIRISLGALFDFAYDGSGQRVIKRFIP